MGKKQKAEGAKGIHMKQEAHRRLRIHAALHEKTMEQLLDELVLQHLAPIRKPAEESEKNAA